MMKKFVLKLSSLLGCLLMFTLLATLPCRTARAALGEGYSIVCGESPSGQPIQCDLSTHRCYLCKVTIRNGLAKSVRNVYNCINRNSDIPKNCTVSNSGGVSGTSDVRILGLKISGLHQEGQNCVTENFKAMYTSTCYSCEIVETLASAFIKAAAKAYQVSREAGNAILVLGMMLWVGFFVLKNISAFTAAEPMKMLQDLLVQSFKVFLAFVLINVGISSILHYTLEPIMNAGTDIADTIIAANTVVDNSSQTGGNND